MKARDGIKVCARCNVTHEATSQFYGCRAGRADGFHPYCRKCVAAFRKESNARNAAKVARRKREDFHRAKRDDPARFKWYAARRRARRYGLTEHCSVDEFRAMYRLAVSCVYCGCVGHALDVDHAVPLSRGGSNLIDNIRFCCPHCNNTKRSKLPSEFLGMQNV